MTEKNDLVVLVEKSSLSKPKVEALMTAFAPAFKDAGELVREAKTIVVKDEDDTESMNRARTIRLKLQRIRTKIVEPTRKELKEQSLRESRAIDGAANIIKALIVPEEEKLQKLEKFAEIKKAERLEKRYSERLEKLGKYVEDPMLYKLREMTDETFEKLLENSKKAHEAQIEAERQAQLKREAEERKNKVYSERREQLLPYIDFIDINELTRETTNTVFNNLLKLGIDTKKQYEADQKAIAEENEKLKKQQEKERKEQEAKLKKEREAREKAEKKLADEKKAQEERKKIEEKKQLEEKKRIENQKKLEEAEAQKKLLAPDKEKLMNLHADLQGVKAPAVQSKKANDVLVEFENKVRIITDWLYEEASKL